MENTKKDLRLTWIVNAISVLVLIMITALILGRPDSDVYYKGIFIVICITVILAVSLNLTSGCLGEMVLGHAAFMSIGAYASSIVLTKCNIPEGILGFVIAIIVGAIAAGLFGLLVGIPALRLKGDYLAIITLGFGEIIRSLIQNIDTIVKELSHSDSPILITGGSAGLKHLPINTTPVLSIIVVIIIVGLLFTLMRSRFGRAVLSIRENDIAAEATGIPVTKYKILIFALAAAMAGVAGAMYAGYMGSIIPTKFDYNYSIEILVIVVLGGLGSFTGSIIASVVIVSLPQVLLVFDKYRMIIYAVALLVVMLTKPNGLLGRYEFSMTRTLKDMKNWPRKFVSFFKNFPKNVHNFLTNFRENIKMNYHKFLDIFKKRGAK